MCGANPRVLWFLLCLLVPGLWGCSPSQYPSLAADVGSAFSNFEAFTACRSKMKLIILAFPLFLQGYFGKRFLCFVSPCSFQVWSLPFSVWVYSNCVPCWEGRGEQRKLHLLFLSLTHSEVWLTAWFRKGGTYFMERTWSPLGPVLKLHLQQPGVNRNCQYFEFGIGTGAVEYFFFSSFFFNTNWSGPLSQSRGNTYIVKQKILCQGSYLISVRFTNEFYIVEFILLSGAF